MCHVGEESRLSTEEEEEEKEEEKEEEERTLGARVASGSQQDIPSVVSAAGCSEHLVVETKEKRLWR